MGELNTVRIQTQYGVKTYIVRETFSDARTVKYDLGKRAKVYAAKVMGSK